MRRRTVLTGMIALAAGPGHGQPSIPTLSAPEAHDGLRAGRLVLVDIRTPEERADTGAPQGAVRLDVDASGFEVRLAGLRLDNPGKRIVLIDRNGGDAVAIQQKLAGRGWRDVSIVRGGMLGPGGWLAEKLPVMQ